jgi:hypothetical protein
MDKMVDIFTPELIEAQRRYARELLGHVNAYRKVRYADDPAVAFVEISNEDSLFMWGADQELQTLPSYYADILQGQYQAYLKAKYGTDDKLRAAWAQGSQPLGESLVRDPAFRLGPGQSAWTLEQHESARATAKPLAESGVRIEIAQNDPTSWHLQFNQAGLKLRKDQYYTVLFKARADQPRTVILGVSQAHQPWGGLGLSKPVSLTKYWQEFRAGFFASADDDNARVSFILGQSNIALEIDQLELRPGGIEGLGKDETLAGKVALFGQCESRPRLLDRLCFFAQVEKVYFDGMYGFIKKDLGCKALVTGTIAFGPLGLYAQSGMDYIDAHAYWQHPHFPGRPWDPKDWLVEQKAMVDDPEGSTLYGLACQRLAGKPFTVSEYNHPAPNDYQAECVPMIAAFAALQNWDGVWLFAYNHSDEFATDRIRGFFDIDGNPAKWGFMPSGAIMFSKAGVPPSPKILQRGLTPGGSIVELAELQLRRGIDLRLDKQELSIADKYPIGARMFCRLGGRNEVQGTSTVGKDVIPDLGAFDVHIVKDFTPPNSPTPAHFYVISVTPLDAKRPDQCRRLLVTAMGRCENTGMKFTADRRSVGTDWGKAPVLIEPVTMDFGLPVTSPDWRCRALSPDGLPAGEVPLKSENNRLVLPLSAQHKTMWYLLTR